MLYSPADLADQRFDVLIVGSGPAGIAIAEGLYANGVSRIGVLERGGILATTSVRKLLDDNECKQFISAHEAFLWEGDLGASGMMLPAVGGRGIVAGTHRPRFYPEDFSEWPIEPSELGSYYVQAEGRRPSESRVGALQTWTLNTLGPFGALAPSWGMHAHNGDSPVARFWNLIGLKRLMVMPNTLVTGIRLRDERTVDDLICRATPDVPVLLRARYFVLAASPIESARLFLDSGLGQDRPAAGRYLAEHIYCRGTIKTRVPANGRCGQFVSVLIPPRGRRNDPADRFQINVEGRPDPDADGSMRIRLTGSAAMDPCPDNRVTLCASESGWRKAHTSLRYSAGDDIRTDLMLSTIQEVKRALEGDWLEEPQLLPKGRSHHEAGTLRMGTHISVSVVDPHGRVHGIDNLFVADAAVFPSVGVANPMLTLMAWSYRLADYITTLLRYDD